MKHINVYTEHGHGNKHLVWLGVSDWTKERITDLDIKRIQAGDQVQVSIHKNIRSHYKDVYLAGRYL